MNPTGATGLAPLAARYDALFCDIWGVVHNGLEPHPAAVDALRRFRGEAGGRVILITNAARPEQPIAQMLADMGVPRDTYDRIVTSGDVTRTLVQAYAGQTIHHIGPYTDDPMFEGIAINKGDADNAVAVVVTGLNDPEHTPDDYKAELAAWRARDLPLISANPDLVVEVGDRMVYCAGALAEAYAQMGGKVEMAGKPHRPIYEAALQLLGEVGGNTSDRSRILGVGDAVRTDGAGAAGFGLDFLFITGSLHAGELDAFGNVDADRVRDVVAPSGANMVGFMPRLAW